MLAMSEYAYNNSKHSSTKISPFYANYGFEPRTTWPMETQFRNPASQLYGHFITSVHTKHKERFSEATESMKKNYNKKRKSVVPFANGELVMLNGRNIRARHRCRKLEDKMFGPFEILSTGKNQRYCKLQLPDAWKIHPVFNIDLLERYRGTNPMKPVVEIEADGQNWVMEQIIACGPSDENPKEHVFLVKWKDITHEENTLEKYENVAEHNMGVLKDYYERNPEMERDARFQKMKRKQSRRS